MANNRHHGPGMGPVQEKAKDFKGSIMRLLKRVKTISYFNFYCTYFSYVRFYFIYSSS